MELFLIEHLQNSKVNDVQVGGGGRMIRAKTNLNIESLFS